MTPHDLATVLRALDLIHAWDAHCGRSLASLLGRLQQEPAPSPAVVDADRPDRDWSQHRAAYARLASMRPTVRAVLCALAAECPPTATATACARAAFRAAAALEDATSLPIAARVSAAETREVEARHALSHAEQRASVALRGKRRGRAGVGAVEGAESLRGPREAVSAAAAAHAAAVEVRDAYGARVLAAAVGAWLGCGATEESEAA